MAQIHLLPSPLALARLDEIQDETGLTVTAYGEMVKPERPKSAFFMEMAEMMNAINKQHGNPFSGLE